MATFRTGGGSGLDLDCRFSRPAGVWGPDLDWRFSGPAGVRGRIWIGEFPGRQVFQWYAGNLFRIPVVHSNFMAGACYRKFVTAAWLALVTEKLVTATWLALVTEKRVTAAWLARVTENL